MHHNVRLFARAWLALVCIGCGSAERDRDALGFYAEAPAEAEASREEAAPPTFFDEDEPFAAADNDSCAVQRVTLRETRRPIDIIMVLDNSISMAAELDAVERNINLHFSSILEASGADYRVILISRHRNAERGQSDEAKTAICVTRPLSSLAACPEGRPGLSERFFHYGIDVDSHDALARLLDTYLQPDPLYRVTDAGWSAWLREGSRKVFLALTDDDSFTSAREFLFQLTALAPEHFGPSSSQPAFAFHSIVGVAERDPAGGAYRPEEPLVAERCSTADRTAPSAGHTYQTLSRLTGGLRYPLCHLDSYDAIFESIAEDSISRSGLGCSFPVPAAPPGKRLDLERIQLGVDGAADGMARLSKVASSAACDTRGFFVSEEERIELCPALCEALLEEPSAQVSAVFDCGAYVDVR